MTPVIFVLNTQCVYDDKYQYNMHIKETFKCLAEIPTWFIFRKSNDATKYIMFVKANEGELGVLVQKLFFDITEQGVWRSFKGLHHFIYLSRFNGKWFSSSEEG